MTDQEEAAERVDDWVDQAQDIYERQVKVVRIMWIAAAIVVVLVGLALIVFPGGPATIVIPLGLALLAVVFGWARRLLKRVLRKGMEAKNVVADTDTKIKVLGVVALVCFNAGVIALIVLIVF